MTLNELRNDIDAVDERLIEALCERFALVDAVGKLKRETGSAVRDRAREEEILKRVRALAGTGYGDDVAKVYEAMFALSRSREEKIRP